MRQVLLRHHKARLERPLNDVSDDGGASSAAQRPQNKREGGREAREQQLLLLLRGLCAIYACVCVCISNNNVCTYVLTKNKNQKNTREVNELLLASRAAESLSLSGQFLLLPTSCMLFNSL